MKYLLTIMLALLCCAAYAGDKNKQVKTNNRKDTVMDNKKMKVEIWSDVMCPFCYIGKRKLEGALKEFAHADNVEVEWKSFQLDPNQITDPGLSVTKMLADKKGWTEDYARQMNAHVSGMAKQEGLEYNLDKAIVANSFDAHRFSHFAKTKGKGDAAEEALFKAYFTDGKNTADHDVLAQLGESIGLNGEQIKQMLNSDAYANEVKQDIQEAQAIGVNGVPFFVLDKKYAVSGAQAKETFEGALTKAYGEWEQANAPQKLSVVEGAVCKPGGECE